MTWISKPNFLMQIYILTKRSLKLSCRNWGEILTSLLFFIFSIVIFHISIGAEIIPKEYAHGIIFSSICFTIMLACDKLLYEDYKNSTIKQLITSGVNEYAIIISAYLGFVIVFSVAFCLLLPLANLFMHLDMKNILIQLAVTQLLIMNLSAVMLGMRILMISLRSSQMIIILCTPFIIPILIISVLALYNADYLLMLLGYFCFLPPIILFASKRLLND